MQDGKIFPTESKVIYRLHADFTYLGVSGLQAADRVGVFSFEAKKNDVVTNSAIVLTSASANVKMEYRTITVGIGESVTINLSKGGDLTDLRWRHNYGEEIHNLRGNTSAVIENIRRKDDGVYECYTGDSPNGTHGIMRLIVRTCPSPKWNPPDCEMNCPVCYNGGVCEDKTGVCICPAGFNGDSCKNGCGNNNWGRDCNVVCSSSGNCRGSLLCPPDPVGCTCINGFGGKDCTSDCGNGYYGADCQQKCNCANSNCNRVTGCNSASECSSGYTGDQCLEPMSCSPGFFGVLCNFPCHCKDSEDCNRDGSCTNGCHEAWAGPKCSIALPYRSEPPTVNQTATTLTFDVTWIPGEDYGTGTITRRKLSYKSTQMDSFIPITESDNDLFIVIDNLIPNTQYQFYSQFSRMVCGIGVDGPRSTLGQTITICTKPLEEPNIEFRNIKDHEVTIRLMPFSSAPERIKCNYILRYQVKYSDIDGNIQDVVNTTSSTQLEVELSGLSSCTAYVVNARVVNDFEIAGNWGEDMMVQTSPSEPSLESNPFTNGTHLEMKWNASWCDIPDYQVTYHYELSSGIFQQGRTEKTEVVLFGGEIEPSIEYTFTVLASYLNVNGTSDTTKFRLGTNCDSPNKSQSIQGYVIGVVIGSILWTVITVAVTLTVSKRFSNQSEKDVDKDVDKASATPKNVCAIDTDYQSLSKKYEESEYQGIKPTIAGSSEHVYANTQPDTQPVPDHVYDNTFEK
ncbi:uncharacterized protein [Antedon mediterranea]|uniref:uncharacterized protein n=1 Tax=Antedon mediterranea TaxID=105859 RepID=UPI003AF747CE